MLAEHSEKGEKSYIFHMQTNQGMEPKDPNKHGGHQLHDIAYSNICWPPKASIYRLRPDIMLQYFISLNTHTKGNSLPSVKKID